MKYHKLSKKDRQLRQPLEQKLIKLSSLALFTFLITLLAISALAPVQPTSADEILFAAEATGGSVSLSTTGTVNLSMETTASGSVRTAADTVKVTSGTTGYQLYLSTASTQTALVRDGATATSTNPLTYAETDLIPTLIDTPISSPTRLKNNTWGFAVTGTDLISTASFDETYPTDDNSTAESRFASVPSHGNDVLISKHSSSASEIPTTFYYGVKATTAKPSGLYKNTIVYTAISDSTTANLASVTPEQTTMLTGGELITISTPSTLTLDSLDTITVTVGGSPCLSPTASKNEAQVNVTCYAPALATGWHEVIASFANETYVVSPGIEYYSTQPTVTMQDFTAEQCVNLSVGATVTLTDARDNNQYSVTKLPDHNCWMTTNLMLGNTITSSGSIEINSSNSDHSGNAFSISSANVMTSGKTNNWTSNDYDVLHIYARQPSETDANGNSYGNLYNWYTATAKTGTQSLTSGNAPSSLCPKGWKLPMNTGVPSLTNLFQISPENGGLGQTVITDTDNTEFVTAIRSKPYNYVFTGSWNGGYISNINTWGVNWSSTANSSDYAYSTNYSSTGQYDLQFAYYKYTGRAIRCTLINS